MKRFITSIVIILGCAAAAFAVEPGTCADSKGNAGRVVRYPSLAKGNVQLGLSVGGGQMKADDAEFLGLLTGINGNLSYTLFTPAFGYAVADNQVIGVRFNYIRANADMETLTAGLPSEGLTFDFDDYKGGISSIGGAVFHRTYFGIDKGGYFAFFTEESLGYSHMGLGWAAGYPDMDRTSSDRVRLAFSPGFVAFPMKFVSVAVSVSMADITYTRVKSFHGGEQDGSRQGVSARYGINLTGINLGMNFHF